MAAYAEGDIEFSILGLVRDPLPDLIQQLASNVRSLELVNGRLMSQQNSAPNIESPPTETAETILDPDPSLGLTRADIDAAVIKEATQAEYRECPPTQLLQYWQELNQTQKELRERIQEEQQAHRADEDHVTGRRYDYGPAIRTWLRFLARKQLLPELLQ